VAAAWMAASLAVVHWQERSEAPQEVAALTASAIQVVAQAGICAWARPATARRAKAEYEYFMMMAGRESSDCRKRVIGKVDRGRVYVTK
jgi:hypothetical protein